MTVYIVIRSRLSKYKQESYPEEVVLNVFNTEEAADEYCKLQNEKVNERPNIFYEDFYSWKEREVEY